MESATGNHCKRRGGNTMNHLETIGEILAVLMIFALGFLLLAL
jgi:hypothetical protein